MADGTVDLIGFDPLSEVTRRERRMLLGLDVLAIAVVSVPLVPEKVEALGLEFKLANQRALLSIYALVLVYFLVAFVLYALSDYIPWRRAHVRRQLDHDRAEVEKQLALGDEGEKLLNERRESSAEFARAYGFRQDDLSYATVFASYYTAQFVARMRAAFEFLLPIAVSVYAIARLLIYKG